MECVEKMELEEIKNNNIKPNAAAIAVLAMVYVQSHDVGLVDFNETASRTFQKGIK